MKRYHTVLSIAGSDSIGGAGIQADIKTCTALGTYAMTAITAITAQNTVGVSGVEQISDDMLLSQIDAVCADICPDAVKTGMLPTAMAVRTVARAIAAYKLRNVVVDPVMVATSGDSLSSESTCTALLTHLIPLATIVTPNIPEAEVLSGVAIASRSDMIRSALRILELTGVGAVLLKGGHEAGSERMADLLLLGSSQLSGETPAGGYAEPVWIEHSRIQTQNTHGTGCTLSSAIASYLAMGYELRVAVRSAIEWLQGALRAGADYDMWLGHGAVNHLYNITDGNRDYLK